MTGWYYLHVNGDLIYKNNNNAIEGIRDSDLCRSAWAFHDDRETAWSILVESLSLGARKERILSLAKNWECHDKDAEHYAKYIGVVLGTEGNKKTAKRRDFNNSQKAPCGYGGTYLEAMADLCKQLGFAGGKLGWHNNFSFLVKDRLSI